MTKSQWSKIWAAFDKEWYAMELEDSALGIFYDADDWSRQKNKIEQLVNGALTNSKSSAPHRARAPRAQKSPRRSKPRSSRS